MKMTRKLMALLLAAMMLLTLCACGKEAVDISGKEAVDISGKYYATSCVIDGEEYSCDGEYVLLDEDGTGVMMFMEEEYPIKTWTLSDDVFTFTLEDGDKFVGTYKDGVMDGTIAGMDYVFDMNGATASKKTPDAKTEDTAEAEPAAEPEAEPLEIVPVTDPHTTDGWATEGEYDDCYFKLLNYEVAEADSYSDCDQVIRFYFEYTNNGTEAESAWWNSNFSAYQDGIQLSTESADDRVDADELYHEDIEPGETVTCAVCFGIRSDSPVELMLIDVWDDVNIGLRADIS